MTFCCWVGSSHLSMVFNEIRASPPTCSDSVETSPPVQCCSAFGLGLLGADLSWHPPGRRHGAPSRAGASPAAEVGVGAEVGGAGLGRWEGRPLAQSLSFRLCPEDSQVTSTLSPLQSPHKALPPRPPSHSRPAPPQSLEGLRQMHCHRNDYDKSPIKPKMWSESSLDEPYEKVKKRSSHSHSR